MVTHGPHAGSGKVSDAVCRTGSLRVIPAHLNELKRRGRSVQSFRLYLSVKESRLFAKRRLPSQIGTAFFGWSSQRRDVVDGRGGAFAIAIVTGLGRENPGEDWSAAEEVSAC